jgi:hypothetical protein
MVATSHLNTYNPFWRCLWGQRKKRLNLVVVRTCTQSTNCRISYSERKAICVGFAVHDSEFPSVIGAISFPRMPQRTIHWRVIGLVDSLVSVYIPVREGQRETCPNYEEISESPRNCSCRKGDMQQVTYWGHTDIRCHGELLPGFLCISVCAYVCTYTHTHTRAHAYHRGLYVLWVGGGVFTTEVRIRVSRRNACSWRSAE